MPSAREFFERNVGRCHDAQSLGDRLELCSRYDDVKFAVPKASVNAIPYSSQACDRAVQHRRRKWPIFASMAVSGWALLEAASILAFRCFFLRWADSALIVLAVRGSYCLRLADAPAVSILRRRTKLDGKTNEQVKDRRAHGRQGRDAKESRSAVLRRTVQAGGQGGQGRRGQIRQRTALRLSLASRPCRP